MIAAANCPRAIAISGLGGEAIGDLVDALPGRCVRRVEREHRVVVVECAPAARFERVPVAEGALTRGEVAGDHGLRVDRGFALGRHPPHQARDREERGDDGDPGRTRNVDAPGRRCCRCMTTDAGTTTSAGEGCRSSFASVSSLAACRCSSTSTIAGSRCGHCGSISVTAVPGPCSVRCCCTADLSTICASEGVTGLSISRSTTPAESRLIRPALIVGAADGDRRRARALPRAAAASCAGGRAGSQT